MAVQPPKSPRRKRHCQSVRAKYRSASKHWRALRTNDTHRYRALLSLARQDLAAPLMSLAGAGERRSRLRSSLEAYLESLGAFGVAPPSKMD
jgi:hypothetical protein